jgi:SAM-dependent methyltransferase
MAEFWDERAREDPYFFIDNRERYRAADLDRFWRRGEEDLERILSDLELSLDDRDLVVEIGCGVGRLTRVLAERCAHVVALDISGEMLALAREHNGAQTNIDWVHSDGTSLEHVPDGSADGCFSHVVFQHIPDPAVTLRYVVEMGRVLRPGGWAAFQISNDPRVHRPRRAVPRWRAAEGTLRRVPRGQSDPSWLGCFTDLDALRDAAYHAGLDVQRIIHPGTQFCLVLLRRVGSRPRSRTPARGRMDDSS